MTIYKPNNPERKQEKKPMMVGPEIVIDDKLPLTEKSGGNDVLLLVRRRPVTNMEVLRRRRRIRCAMILLMILLVVATAVIVALIFNRSFMNSAYIGECQVTYHENPLKVGETARQLGEARGSFSESYEVDAGQGQYEKLQVPPVLDFRHSTVLHDFDKNLTTVLDSENTRCFILPLNRANVQPPKSFIDLINKFKSGYYLPDAEIVRETYKVVLPPVKNVEQFGFYIWNDCNTFKTYRLIKAEQAPIVASKKKRSAGCSMLGDGFCLGATLTDTMTCISFSDCSE